MSGGTTGDSMIGAASRDTLRAYPPSLAAIFHLMWGVCDPDKRVLFVNAMSLGAWIGGTYSSSIYRTSPTGGRTSPTPDRARTSSVCSTSSRRSGRTSTRSCSPATPRT